MTSSEKILFDVEKETEIKFLRCWGPYYSLIKNDPRLSLIHNPKIKKDVSYSTEWKPAKLHLLGWRFAFLSFRILNSLLIPRLKLLLTMWYNLQEQAKPISASFIAPFPGWISWWLTVCQSLKFLMSEKIFETNLGLVIYKKFWVSGVQHIYQWWQGKEIFWFNKGWISKRGDHSLLRLS